MSAPPVTVVVAPRRPGLAILSVLKDWSALGLVSDFYWVTDEAADPQQQLLPAAHIRAGSAEAVDLQGELARLGDVPLARVCVVDPMTGPAPIAAGTLASRLIGSATPGTPQRLVQCFMPRLAAPDTMRPTVLQGWEGILVAPQEAQAPLAPRRQIRAGDDPHSVAMHSASGLAAVLGMWQGFATTPLDGLRPGPAGQVRLSEGYLHVRDAAAFEASLRRELTAVYPELPQPVADNRLVPRAHDARGAGSAAADALFSLHEWVLPRKPEPLPARSAKQIGLVQALRMFAGFLWASLRRAPQRWWQRVLARGSRTLAAMTQQAVFGSDSEYDVVVRGWLPNGQLATPGQVDEAARSILRQLDPNARHEEAAATFPDFWRDFHGVALDLADGAQRVPGAQAPRHGGLPAVVGTAPAIAPGPWEAFTLISPHLASVLGVDHIAASDLRTTELVGQRLESVMQQRSDLAHEANETRSRVAEWSRRTQQDSYSGRVGARLVAAQAELRQRIGNIREALAALTSAADPDEDFAAEQQRLTRRARWLFWAGVAVVAALLLSWNRGWLAGGTAVRWLIVAVILELAIQLYFFLRGQQVLFRFLNRQRELETEASVHLRNLTAALTDLQRIDAAYQQFVPMAEALGSFVAQPLGVPPPMPAGIELPADRLPLSVKIGTVRADDDTVAAIADRLRTRLFPVGWMAAPYRAFLAGAGGMLGPAGNEFARDPGRLFSDPAASGDAPVRRWTAALQQSGTPAALGDETWARAVQLLTDDEFLIESGIGGLPTVWAGGEAPVHGFAAGLDGRAAAAAQFDTEILAPAARSGYGRLVDPATVTARTSTDGMSRAHLLVLLGQPFDVSGLDVAIAEPPVAPRTPTPVQGPRI